VIRVSVEVREGATLIRAIMVQAESISRAVSIARERYTERDVQVAFPIDPDSFFVEDSKADPIAYERAIHN
jgi:hypothetical protein